MDGFIYILSIILFLLGLAGCIIPGLLGPPLVCVGGILIACLVGDGLTLTGTLIIGALIAITILDFILPSLGVKKLGGTNMGMTGAFIGMFVGLFIPIPLGSILGCFLGAVLFEKIEGLDWDKSFKAGVGAVMMMFVSTFVKIIACMGGIIYFLTIAQKV